MLAGLRAQVPGLRDALVARSTLAVVGAGIAGAVAAWIAPGLAGDRATPGLVAGAIAGVAVYAGALAALAPAEARAALAFIVPAWAAR
jgi:hypothetical protein